MHIIPYTEGLLKDLNTAGIYVAFQFSPQRRNGTKANQNCCGFDQKMERYTNSCDLKRNIGDSLKYVFQMTDSCIPARC